METFHKKVLQKNHTQIVDDLDLGKSSVLDSLREDGLISSNEEEIILSERTKRNQNTKLLNYLKKRDPAKQPYDSFKRALTQEYGFIVEKLNKSENELCDLAKDNRLNKCTHCVLSKNLVPPDVTHILYENGILTDDDLEDLNNDNLPRQDRVKKLLELLSGKADQQGTIEQFNNCLETKYNYLVRRDNVHSLKPYLECCCNDTSGNATVNDNSKENGKENKYIVQNNLSGKNCSCDKCNTHIDDCSVSCHGLKRQSMTYADTVLQSLQLSNNVSFESRTACESSWSEGCRSCELSLSENGKVFVYDKESCSYDINCKDTISGSKNNYADAEISSAKTNNMINDLSKHGENRGIRNGFYNVKDESVDLDAEVQSGEDNTLSTEQSASSSVGLCYSRSICEDSWEETADEVVPLQNECSAVNVLSKSDEKGLWIREGCKHGYSIDKSAASSGLILSKLCEFKTPFGTGTVSLDTMIGLASNVYANEQHSKIARLMTMPFNAHPSLRRLSSSDSGSGPPFGSDSHQRNHDDCFRQQRPANNKSKKRAKRKKAAHINKSQCCYDDVDGNPDEEKEKKVENDNAENVAKAEEKEDVEEEASVQGACASLLQPMFKFSPNNKKLMRKCSRLWDQLFFLRETGDWETFGLVTKKSFEKFKNSPDIQVLLYRSEMCVSTFYKNDQTKALEMFDKALEELPKTEMPNWHLARILPLKVELCTRAKMFEEASNLLEDAKQAMMSLGPCLSTGAVYFFEAIYLGNILQCTRNDTKSAEGITEQVKRCFLTAIEHYQQEETFAIQSFLNQVYLFLALFSLGVDFKKITYIQSREIKREDISLAEHYLNLFENNCWGNSTIWSRMLFYIGRGEQHKQINNQERSLDYFKQAKFCCKTGKFGEHMAFIENNIDVVSEKLEEHMRLLALRSEQSADDILKKVMESTSSSSEFGSSADN